MKLTKKQKQLLDYVEQFIVTHGYSPTFREIMRGLEYKSVSTVAKHIDNLVAGGYLSKENGVVRSLEVGVSQVDPWQNLLDEIRRRESLDTTNKQDIIILRQSLEILRKG